MATDRVALKEKIMAHDGDVFMRYGFGWKGAEWYKTTKENLIATLDDGNWAHFDVYDEPFGINFYSANDML